MSSTKQVPQKWMTVTLAVVVLHRREISFFFLALIAVLTLPGNPASAAGRFAFAVGIDVYDHFSAPEQLKNPVKDARAVAQNFGVLGYEVTSHENLTRSQFNNAWQAFLDKISGHDTVALFLSGHGVEIEGDNFLLPRDMPYVRFGRQEQVRNESINISQLLLDLRDRHPDVVVLILDACRENPLIPPEYKAGGSDRGGLAEMHAANGEFIMYSAAAGQAALDRLPGEENSKHSVYVRNLLPLMQEAHLRIQDLAQTLRRKVYQQTQDRERQLPAYYDGLIGEFCLGGCTPAVTPSARVTEIDPATLEAGLNLGQEERKAIQRALTMRGFDTRGIDGAFGGNTRRAIATWQRARGEQPTGYLTPSQYDGLLAEGASLVEPATAGHQGGLPAEERGEEKSNIHAVRDFSLGQNESIVLADSGKIFSVGPISGSLAKINIDGGPFQILRVGQAIDYSYLDRKCRIIILEIDNKNHSAKFMSKCGYLE